MARPARYAHASGSAISARLIHVAEDLIANFRTPFKTGTTFCKPITL